MVEFGGRKFGLNVDWLVVSKIVYFKVLGSDHLTVGEPYSYGESEFFVYPICHDDIGRSWSFDSMGSWFAT